VDVDWRIHLFTEYLNRKGKRTGFTTLAWNN